MSTPPSATPFRDFFRLRPSADVHWLRVGIGVWCTVFIGIAIYSLCNPGSHSVSPVYWTAARQWWASEEMYGSKEQTIEGLHGFLYFPHAAMLFTPWAYLPLRLAEVLWRLLCIGSVGWALWKMCGVFGGRGAGGRQWLWFGMGTLLAVSAATLSSQNGQCNLPILAIMSLATVAMIERRWWPAALWLALGLVLKPHVLVLILLVGVLHPPMRWRLLVALAAAASLAWLHPDWSYVWQQHVSFVQKMRVVTHPDPGQEQSLQSLLWTFDVILPDRVWTVINLIGAAAASLLALFATRRFERASGLLSVLTISILYIMIFNPRTEAATHAMMAIPLALYTLQELLTRPRPLAYAMVAVCVLMGISQAIITPVNRWMMPMLELWFTVYLAGQVIMKRPAFGGAPGAAAAVPA